jgi:hydroxyacylglutathione hydrolase
MKRNVLGLLGCVSFLLGAMSFAGSPDMQWDPGAEGCADFEHALVQAHAIDDMTIVFRQNPCVDFEANLLYLLIGQQRALLIDTGAVDDERIAAPLAKMVASYLKTPGGTLPLLVAHTHGHEDHRLGDAAFAKLPNVKVAPLESVPLRKFFGFRHWPDDVAQIDLGNRIVDLIPTPGHHQDHIVFYDRDTQLLLTGDFLLPGRLIVEDIDAYRASAQRVSDFVKTHPVSHALGAHIELDVSGQLYAHGATYHPDERPLALTQQDVNELPAALAEFNGFYSRHPNYVVVNPIHNLIALAAGILAALLLLAWMGRRLWLRRRARI